MDVLQMAKDLIKKGNELEDPELLQMGREMLEKYSGDKNLELNDNSTSKLKVDFTNESVPDVDIELKPELKTKETSNNYKCDNCGEEFRFDKKRKKCPNCRKHKLKPLFSNFEKGLEEELPEGISKIFDKERQKVKCDENGNVVARCARTEPLHNKDLKYNRFVDDGKSLDDAENRLLKTMPRAPRTRKPFKKRSVVCVNCQKPFDVHPAFAPRKGSELGYRCDNCIGAMRGST